MKTVCNKTQRPLSVPLPRGKTLHLGPGKTGQIASAAAEHPGLKKLIEAGQIEITGEGSGASDGPGEGGASRGSAHGFLPGTGRRRSGDR